MGVWPVTASRGLGVDEIEASRGPQTFADLVAVGARVNSRRPQLLVSRVLGKHIPTLGVVAEAAGLGLAQAVVGSFRSECRGVDCPTLVVGFAETACGLGFLVAASLPGSSYAQTTRDLRDDPEVWLAFTESHSHAPEHQLLEGVRTHAESCERVVLVDDELTTGATAWGLIRRINAEFPGRQYVVACLVDARSTKSEWEFATSAAAAGVDVRVVALVRRRDGVVAPSRVTSGRVHPARATDVVTAAAVRARVCLPDLASTQLPDPRWGLTPEQCVETTRILDAEIADAISKCVAGRVLVLGVEEGMHSAIRVAARLGAHVQSTSRSPAVILARAGYPIQTGVTFTSAYDAGVDAFLYNSPRPSGHSTVFDDVLLIDPAPRGAAYETSPGLLAAALLCCSGTVWRVSPEMVPVPGGPGSL